MAGGRGTRLEPYTTVLPKPLMPLTDRPIIDVILHQLVRAGVEGAIVSVGHLGSLIESWVGQQGNYGIPIRFVYEDEPLGTAGSLAKIEPLDGTFLAMNGDILTTLAYRDLVEHHRRVGATATVAVTSRAVQVDYGLVHADSDGRLVGLEEKPELPYTVSMGVYAFEPEITRHIGSEERIDFPDLLLRAAGAGDLVVTYPFDGYWRDIGNREDYAAAIDDFAVDRSRFSV